MRRAQRGEPRTARTVGTRAKSVKVGEVALDVWNVLQASIVGLPIPIQQHALIVPKDMSTTLPVELVVKPAR